MDYETLDRVHPYRSYWTIRVRVGQLFDIYEYNNAKGSGKLQKLIVVDEKGDQMQITLFNSDVDKFAPILQEGGVYRIENIKVANSPEKFRVVPHKYQLNFTKETAIEKVDDECSDIPLRRYHFTEFDSLHGLLKNEGNIIDIIGLIVAVGSVIDIQKKGGSETMKRDIVVVDTTTTSITLTLWGLLALKYDDELVQAVDKRVVLVATSLKVREYQGDLYLSSTPSTILTFDPSIPERTRIVEWLNEGGNSDLFDSSQSLANNVVPKFPSLDDRVPIIELIEAASICPTKSNFYTIKGTIVRIHTDKPFWYAACKICKKKVCVDGKTTTCVSCDLPNPSVLLRFCVKIDVQDFTTQASFVLFNNEVESLIGCTPSEFQESTLQATENNILEIKLKDCIWKDYWFQVRVAPENHRYITVQGFTVSKIEECEYNEDGRKLSDQQYKKRKLDVGETSGSSESLIYSGAQDAETPSQ